MPEGDVGVGIRVGIGIALGLLLGVGFTAMGIPQAWCEGWCHSNGYGRCQFVKDARWQEARAEFECVDPKPDADPVKRRGVYAR